MMNQTEETEYPIAAVSKLTGVSCHALRVWERRYGFPIPLRSASGHRRYRHEQVVQLRRIYELSQQGRSISDLISDLREGRLQIDTTQEHPGPARTEDDLSVLLECLQRADLVHADDCMEMLERKLGPRDLVSSVIGPALTETGERWFRRKCAIYQERCISGFLRRKLNTLIDQARRGNTAPRCLVVAGSVQGDRHEGGVLIVNLLLELAGWRVINLGTDVPVDEYQRTIDDLRPNALALSFVLSRNINKRFQELSRLHGAPVFVGGRSILNYQKLARRHGLHPIAGCASVAIDQLMREYAILTGSQTQNAVR